MDHSPYLTKVVEPFVVDWVSMHIGVSLMPQRVMVVPRIDGTPVYFSFDGVSANRDIGLLVSTSHTAKPGVVRKLYVDASILLQAPFMAFVFEDIRVDFINKCDGSLPLGKIEMLVCDLLSDEMVKKILEFQAKTKKEVGDKGKVRRTGNDATQSHHMIRA